MQLISAERMNLTSLRQLEGTSSTIELSYSGLSLNRPSSALSNFSCKLTNHFGCVKSPVPTTVRPLNCAQRFRFSISISLLVALEYGECIWRSDINFIL